MASAPPNCFGRGTNTEVSEDSVVLTGASYKFVSLLYTILVYYISINQRVIHYNRF